MKKIFCDCQICVMFLLICNILSVARLMSLPDTAKSMTAAAEKQTLENK